MAGPSIVVRVLGDLKGLSSAVSTAGKNAESAASRLHGAFSNALGVLNRTGVLGPFGESLAAIDEGLSGLEDHGKRIGQVMMGAGAVMAGVGGALSALGSKEQSSHAQLQAAIEATGHSYDDYGDAIEKAIKHNEKYGQSSVSTQGALQALTQATHDPQKALQLLGTATDLAAAKHTDLVSAAGQIGKVYNGNTKLLKQFGITVDKTTGLTKDHQTATQALAGVLQGQAAASVDSFTGKIKVIGTQLEDQAAQIGQKYGPAITAAGAAFTVAGGLIDTAGGILSKFGKAAGDTQKAVEGVSAAQKVAAGTQDALTASESAGAVAEYSLLGPILLIIAAIAALGVAAYVIYRNWNTIWAGMKAAAEAVWNWIKTYWPLLLTILLGPVGLAIAGIIRYWDQIKAGAASVILWIRTNWPLLVAIITGPIGLAVLAVQRNWSTITRAAAAVISWFASTWQSVYHFITAPVASAIGWVEGAFNSFVGWISGLPGRVGGVFSHIWDSFAGVLRRIVGGWNSLHFTLPSIDTHIPGIGKIGGSTVGVPPISIPGLATGGLVMSEGLAYLHAAEVVTPAPDAGRAGPAVVVENANFATELDIETFMRRAAWVVRTARV